MNAVATKSMRPRRKSVSRRHRVIEILRKNYPGLWGFNSRSRSWESDQTEVNSVTYHEATGKFIDQSGREIKELKGFSGLPGVQRDQITNEK